MSELPQISNCYYGTNTYDGTGLLTTSGDFIGANLTPFDNSVLRQMNITTNIKNEREDEIMTERRLIKVFIVDPDDEVPLDKCLLYSGEEKLTDLTDQELFFEIPVKELLDKHNNYRETVERETNKDKTEFLKPIRIRDLKMVVVTVASF